MKIIILHFFIRKICSNFDFTHYAELGVNLEYIVSILKDKIKTIHLSNYSKGKSHLSIRKGAIDMNYMLTKLNKDVTEIITLEVEIPVEIRSNRNKIVEFLIDEREYLENIISCT